MKLKAGAIFNRVDLVPQPLPYGAIPRLVLIAAITKALQHKTRTIELGRSISESLRNLGLGRQWRSALAQLRQAAASLAAVDMVLGYMQNSEAKTVKGRRQGNVAATRGNRKKRTH